jgi:hypothetical protein
MICLNPSLSTEIKLLLFILMRKRYFYIYCCAVKIDFIYLFYLFIYLISIFCDWSLISTINLINAVRGWLALQNIVFKCQPWFHSFVTLKFELRGWKSSGRLWPRTAGAILVLFDFYSPTYTAVVLVLTWHCHCIQLWTI